MNIIFDLDGTLIDAKPRLYQLFQQLVPASKMTFAAYWELKFSGHSNEKIVSEKFGFDAPAIAAFRQEWMLLIESPFFLEMDTLFSGMHEALAELKLAATLHVCTARQFIKPVITQLERLNLLGYFGEIMVTEQRNSKASLIAQTLTDLSQDDWIIGDTGKDIQVGAALGIHTCAVLTGFMTADALSRYQPNLILGSAIDFRL